MKFSGIVKRGSARGKELGFPTANLVAPDFVEDGIYVGLANKKPSLIFIGVAETFGETLRNAEIYVLDFDRDLYDKKIEIEVIKKLRESKKFDSKEELIEQMKDDEKVAREFFSNYNRSN
jgi:riboflavin kinase/FMN adenylyltransferase